MSLPYQSYAGGDFVGLGSFKQAGQVAGGRRGQTKGCIQTSPGSRGWVKKRVKIHFSYMASFSMS